MSWGGFTPLAPVCVDCESTLDEWDGPTDTAWCDAAEERHGRNALAIQTHRHTQHRVNPKVDDLVTYSTPWRGHVLESEVYRVVSFGEDDAHAFARAMRGDDLAPLMGISYTLVNPNRRDDLCFPFVGDPSRPVTFRLVAEAPPVETDLLDLLAWDDVA